ncbi:MAG TPA: hypothetical protein VIM73_05110 [Polyangiaceae bacterium]
MKRVDLATTALLLLVSPHSLWAQTAVSAPAAPPADARLDPPDRLTMLLELGSSNLDPSLVKAQIELEVGRPVSLVTDGTAPLSVRVRGRNQLVLQYSDPRNGKLERSVDLPEDPRRATEVIALLVGNVVRNEASEILRTLQEPETGAGAVEPASTSSTPPPSDRLEPPEPEPTPEPPTAARPTPERSSGLRPPFDRLIDGPVKLNLSLFHPLTLLPDSDRRRLNVELGLFYSRIGAIEGVALNFGALSIEEHARGVALGVLWTRIGGAVRGLSLSAVGESGGGSLFGASVGGVFSHRRERVEGLQLAGAVAVAGELEGVQAAGAVNISKSVEGVVAAGAVNVVQGRAKGLIAAGGVNVAGSGKGILAAGGANVAGEYDGTLVAGGFNATREMRGLSVATVNVNRRVKGVQIGVVNVSEQVDGVSLAIINIARNGRIQPVAWSSTTMPMHVGMKFVVGYVYTELGWGYSPNSDRHAPEGGGGLHFQLNDWLYVEPGVFFSDEHEVRSDGLKGIHGDVHTHVRGGVRVLDSFELFAGIGARHGVHGTTSGEIRPEAHAGIAIF